MNLNAAQIHWLRIPLDDSYRTAHHDGVPAVDSVLVVLSTADGTRGIGTADVLENAPYQSPTAMLSNLGDRFVPRVVEDSPETPNAFRRTLTAVDGNERGNEAARCALETAYLDLYCRHRGQSLAELFGGALCETEPLNGWVGIDSPDRMAENARQLLAAGFGSIKIKLEGDPEADIERVRAVHEAVGDVMDIRADVNTGYGRDVSTAIDVARELEAYDLAHFEQPLDIDEFEGMVELTAATDTRIMADEPVTSAAACYRILEMEAADRLKLKPLRMGGPLESHRGLTVAKAAGIDCVVGHGFGVAPATSAELQLVAAHENVFRPVESVGPLKMESEPFAPRIRIEDGTAAVPDGPGLGIELVDDALAEFTVESRRVE